MKINNVSHNNMSTWQITHTVNTLTTVNNKFDILKTLNNHINSDIKKCNIFILDKSYSFNTNYKTYFSEYVVETGEMNIEVDKICNMGNLVTMECNDDIMNINILFDLYKKLSSIINKNLKYRLKKEYLQEAYKLLFEKNLDLARSILLDRAKEQICDTFERRISPDYLKMKKIVEECEKANNDKKIIKRHEQVNDEYECKFEYLFNSCTRPIVGIFDNQTHKFTIINADQMYMNGEEAKSQIRLKEITKNSPVMMAFIVAGVMGGVMAYLAYRNHNVNSFFEYEDILNIPSNRKDAINNIFLNEDDSFFDNNNKSKKVDEKIMNLATDTYSRLEGVTDSKKVSIDYKMNIEIKE
ncbi:MAG: hypothetical protein KIC94_01390 [Clostridiales bacterium]|nr:hypothetical protein [Clostridiales bacterium]